MRDQPHLGRRGDIRVDLALIAAMVTPGARVLDVGCGDGTLLDHLVHARGCDGRGVELSQAGVNACVSHGLSVVQGDADTDLTNYPSQAFDYVILSQTLQATRDPRKVLTELVRIGRRAIVSFPNFGHWRVRWHLVWQGRMPRTAVLREEWFETPNIHLCTITDFVDLAAALGITVEQAIALNGAGRRTRWYFANLSAEQGVFLLRGADQSPAMARTAAAE